MPCASGVLRGSGVPAYSESFVCEAAQNVGAQRNRSRKNIFVRWYFFIFNEQESMQAKCAKAILNGQSPWAMAAGISDRVWSLDEIVG
jgi:hypothetical protein